MPLIATENLRCPYSEGDFSAFGISGCYIKDMEIAAPRKNWKDAVRQNTYYGARGSSVIALACLLLVSFKDSDNFIIDYILLLSAIAGVICAPIYAVIYFKQYRWHAFIPLMVIAFVLIMHKYLGWVLLWVFAAPFVWFMHLFS